MIRCECRVKRKYHKASGGNMYYTTIYDSPLGEIMIAADSKGIAGLWIQGQKYFEDMGEAGATSTAEFVPASNQAKTSRARK